MRVLAVPFHLGHEGAGTGAGPAALAAALGADAGRIALEDRRPHELGASFAVNRALGKTVLDAERGGEPVLVLAGDCMASQAVVRTGRGIVWLDAHGDLHTPETTPGGFVDGCALSMCLGEAFRALCATVPGAQAASPADVVLAGVRDVDPGEEERIAASPIAVVRGAGPLAPALDALRDRVGEIHLHLDLDVLEGRANALAPAGGWTAERLLGAVAAVRERFAVASMTLASYDPAGDEGGTIAAAGAGAARAALA